MRSPLEIIDGRFDHALLTTYSFNLRFFEERVLRALWAADVRNVVVFVDARELGNALADRAPSAAGRAYHVVAASSAKAAFHSKVLLLSGKNGSRLCVSSANLTPDGQLRNAESAISFDGALPGHQAPIQEAAEFFRLLSPGAPPHTAAAIQAALADLTSDPPEESSPYRFLHNLDHPLLDAFPEHREIRATSPYVDVSGMAASKLHERGRLEVIVDGKNIAASAKFFAAPWGVDARRFDARLHGKSYQVTTETGYWIMVGSPNLSEPALLRNAAAGNLEAAVTVESDRPLEIPASEPWDEPNLGAAAASRLNSARSEQHQGGSRAFDAWEDEGRIVVAGLPDGTRVERWWNERWDFAGVVVDGAILAEQGIRPSRLRATVGEGQAHGIVAQPARLRARMRAPTRGRQTAAVEMLPLDLETVRTLEDALSQLYALSELAGEETARRKSLPNTGTQVTPAEPQGELLDWAPRHREEEPRVPRLYVEAWEGEPDALLALVSRVLRLDPEVAAAEEDEVGRERLGVAELEDVTGSEQLQARDPAPPPIQVGRAELDRYRRAFARLFDRGRSFIRSAPEPTLAGWAFTYLARLAEELGGNSVSVGSNSETLMRRRDLRPIELGLLFDYLSRDERDLLCLATAKMHLAAVVRDRARYTPGDIERIDALAYKWAADLMAVPGDVPGPRRLDLHLDADAAIWLADYADRSRWGTIADEASARLEGATLSHDPFPTVAGSARYSGRVDSPAWSLLAFAAPSGYASKRPFAVAIRNGGDGPVRAHVLVCVPEHRHIIEAFQRMHDRSWLECGYSVPRRGIVERLTGPVGLERSKDWVDRRDLSSANDLLTEISSRYRSVV